MNPGSMVTYCSNASCPFEDCEHHLTRLTSSTWKPLIRRDSRYVSIADYSGICRRYIGYLVDYITKGK